MAVDILVAHSLAAEDSPEEAAGILVGHSLVAEDIRAAEDSPVEEDIPVAHSLAEGDIRAVEDSLEARDTPAAHIPIPVGEAWAPRCWKEEAEEAEEAKTAPMRQMG